jgi:AraC family transcriptional activator of pobA
MDPEEIRISRIIKKTTNKPKGNYYVVIWVKDDIEGIEIDGSLIKNVSNTLFFLDPIYQWKILTNNDKNSKRIHTFFT